MKTCFKNYLSIFFTVLLLVSVPVLRGQGQPSLRYGILPINLVDNVVAGSSGTGTLSVANMTSQILTATPTSMAITYTTPTATALCAAFPWIGAKGGINWSYDWWVKDTAGSALTVTLAGGSGVTLVGTGTAVQNNLRHFKVQFRSCGATPAVNLISLDTSAF